MSELASYFSSQEFIDFLNVTGNWLIITTLLVSFVALLFELRLPLRYYWDLPGHALSAVLVRFHLRRPTPVWGISYNQATKQAMPVVACDLLDEHTHTVIKRTYTNRKGEYGFTLVPGKYLLRAIKTRYRLPSILDPENVEVYEVDESFVASVTVLNRDIVPVVDLPLVPVKTMAELNGQERLTHYLRMFLFQLGNAFLVMNVLLSLLGWMATQRAFYGLVIAVCIILLFIKLYLLELIRVVGVSTDA